VPDVVPVSHPEFLHDQLGVVEDESTHDGEADEKLNVDESVRPEEDIED